MAGNIQQFQEISQDNTDYSRYQIEKMLNPSKSKIQQTIKGLGKLQASGDKTSQGIDRCYSIEFSTWAL